MKWHSILLNVKHVYLTFSIKNDFYTQFCTKGTCFFSKIKKIVMLSIFLYFNQLSKIVKPNFLNVMVQKLYLN